MNWIGARRLAFALAPAFCLLLAGETAARWWLYYLASPEVYPMYAIADEFPAAVKYAPHHYFCYRLQPGYHRRGTSHNSLGFRGREIDQPKPAGRYRIAILGGSTTYGEFIANDDDAFPARLERRLRELRGTDAIEVVNAGVPGYDSWEALADFEFRVLDLEPDLVIIYHGVNDVHSRLVRPNAYRGDNSARRVSWSEPIEVRLCRFSCLARIIGYHVGLWRHPGIDAYVQAPTADPGTHGASRAIGGDPEVALELNPPIYFARNLRNTAAIARANSAHVVFVTWAHSPNKGDYAATSHYQRGFRENNDVVKAVASEQNDLCFDFAPEMPTKPEYWRDGRHVNERGADLQAKLFSEFLVRNAERIKLP